MRRATGQYLPAELVREVKVGRWVPGERQFKHPVKKSGVE